MSEEPDDEVTGGDEGVEMRRSSRVRMIDAIGEHADSYPHQRGAVLTGYVVVYEMTKIDGGRTLSWSTGDGTKPDDNAETDGGLPDWRCEGMLRYAVRDIMRDNVLRSGDG